MDPATAALTVLPLIVKVFKHYKATVSLFIMLRHSRREARRFGNSLKTQQTIFENECQHLLCLITTNGPEMLTDSGHHLWKDNELERKLCAYLSKSLRSCKSTIERIDEILLEILKETGEGFHELQKPKEESRVILRAMWQKFKLAFSKGDFDGKVDMLRKCNGDLRILIEQVEHLEKHTTADLHSPRFRSKSISRCRTMRTTSQRLYDTLSQAWSCPKHSEHFANICLEENPDRVPSEKVTFDIVFTSSRPPKSTPEEVPMWVTIESMLKQSEGATDSTPLSEPAHYKISTAFESQERREKPVTFYLQSSPNLTVRESAPLDLSTIQNLCFHVQTSLDAPAASSPIGYLQKSETFKHIIYPGKNPKPCTGSIVSLNDALLAARRAYGMWIPEKLRLAKLFALAVLQFHSTPWLDENWRSQDILFFNSSDPSQDSLGSPYLTARFMNPPENSNCKLSNQTASASKSSFLVPNMILFRLGIILLELGLEAPFGELQKTQNMKEGQPKEFSEFFTAKRLASHAVSKKMGSRYSKLVNRCLFCDFGLGGDYELDMTEVQNMLFQHVILELDACLKTVLKSESE